MGFYVRKAIKVGPFRFNLSNSGVSVSAGVRGLRFGTGPRGNYVHMGRNGLYYRATLPPEASSGPKGGTGSAETPVEQSTSSTHEPLREIESADIGQIVDSSSKALLDELNQKRKRLRLWPFAAALGVLLTLLAWAAWPTWAALMVLVASAVLGYVAFQHDRLAKTVVLLYDFDSEMEQAYRGLHQWAEQLAACRKTWHIEAEGRVRDRKYHAGATSLVRRNQTRIAKAHPPYVKTNIETISMGVGRQTLHFFPDRLLVYDKAGVGAVSYSELQIETQPSQFIEEDGVPSDAQVIGHTWKYVNKKGGPDRRFKDNRQLPVCLYDEMALRSPSGLNEVVQVSRNGVAEGFREAVVNLGVCLPPETRETAS